MVLRKWFLLIASFLMILSLPNLSLIWALSILGLSLITYLCGATLGSKKGIYGRTARKFIAGIGIGIVLLYLAFFKYHFLQKIIVSALGFSRASSFQFVFLVGVSYFSFKMIHFLVDSYRTRIENLSLLQYLNFVFFFVPFISGPINRYNNFSLQEVSSSRADWKAGLERIVHGLFKKFVLAQILFPYILGNQGTQLDNLSLSGLILGLYSYAFYFYFDFAGYSDLAIGTARLMGIGLPENFNNPFLKRNIRELWTNWHMSLTNWLVDYIYWPIVRGLRNQEFFRRHPIALSNIGMVITFIICGMWHGQAPHFIIWGAYHGVGIAILTIYQRQKRKVKNAILQSYFHSGISHALGIFLTFNFFVFGLSLFVLDLPQLLTVAYGLFR